jgi:hypothetical protein
VPVGCGFAVAGRWGSVYLRLGVSGMGEPMSSKARWRDGRNPANRE